jgi:catechol 2,3-dioxygenase-like lactoylglutathione lyase family enzyme
MSDRPVFDQINVVVRDMAAMIEFYRELGLDIAESDPGWEQHHRKASAPGGFVDLDSQAFARQWNQGWPGGANGTVIGFRVVERATVDQLYDRLVLAGYQGQQAPYDAFWGALYAVVADPDGNSVGIMSASDPSRRSRPTPPAG